MLSTVGIIGSTHTYYETTNSINRQLLYSVFLGTP